MNKALLWLVIPFLTVNTVQAQEYIGSGNTTVNITTSHNADATSGENVLSGKGLNAKKYAAARFLSQSTFHYSLDDINLIEDTDYSEWIDSEIAKPITYLTPIFDVEYQEAQDLYFANGGTGDYYGPSDKHFNYGWWTMIATADDKLRQRIAFALSEIFVISGNSDLGEFGEGLSVFYDLLLDGSFGNFRDLIEDVTYSPSMGFYLSHLNNPKTQGNIRPDENYAREIMQLFTIGLYELNNDGSFKTDGSGNEIPTYDNADIKEFAKVFTGLKGGGWDDDSNNTGIPSFGVGIYGISKRVPMVPHATQHQSGLKTLLNGATTNSNTTGDIDNALDNLFNHPNVGPFIGRRLIQRLVKSNPSPAYINRVANAFNDSNGVRGDMAAVIKAVLMDEEARQASYINAGDAGMLKEPIVKFAQVVGQLDKENPSGNFWNNGFDFSGDVSQHPMQSPTVFNFFLPDFKPSQLGGMYAPEMQIFNTRTSINWINYVHKWTVWQTLFWDWEGDYTENVYVDYSNYTTQAEQTEEYINMMDMIFTAGTLSDFTREQVRTAMNGFNNNSYNKARLGLFLILCSPEYSVLR